jgi:hypothetical protein
MDYRQFQVQVFHTGMVVLKMYKDGPMKSTGKGAKTYAELTSWLNGTEFQIL